MNQRRGKPEISRPGAVRIIGGQWRGTRLQVPDLPGLRPTADRVRETLFNWLMPILPGARVLDLFAGSGALGLEAASRGAALVQLIETNPQLVNALGDAVQRLQVDGKVAVQPGDALDFLRNHTGAKFDIAFVDPPFAAGLWPQVLELLPAHMAAEAWLYLESPTGITPQLPPEWALHRENHTRDVRYALYRRATIEGSLDCGRAATT